MKPPTFAPIYVGLFVILSERARTLGYALAVHGTATRDLDLIAVPWTNEAIDPDELVIELMHAIRVGVGDSVDGKGRRLDQPEVRPHGRLAWIIPLGCGATLDLSVTPKC